VTAFTLEARWDHPTPRAAGEYFDRFHRAAGVHLAQLDDGEQAQYLAARKAYMRVCAGARRNLQQLQRRRQAGLAWALGQARAGRAAWGCKVPAKVMRAADRPATPAAAPATAPRRRPRERRARSRPPGRQPDEPDELLIAREAPA
jgi:hypothetical protein